MGKRLSFFWQAPMGLPVANLLMASQRSVIFLERVCLSLIQGCCDSCDTMFQQVVLVVVNCDHEPSKEFSLET